MTSLLPVVPAAAPKSTSPLLIVGHGTRDPVGVAQFRAFVERVRRRASFPVEGGFIELAPPPVADAVTSLMARGHTSVVAVPLVLVAAGHAKGDIPASLARESVRHPGFRYRYGRPLGPHPTLLRLLDERLGQALDNGQAWARRDTAVLLVGRGSTDPDANAEVTKVARLLLEGRPMPMVETSFVSLAEPGVAAGLERCRRLGARRVVVLPYFLFAGVLPDRISAQAQAWGEAHPEVEVRGAAVLGDCDGLADVVLERYAEALAGDLRMNCDTCVYRVPMAGFEAKVGAPAHPHDHPDDPADASGHGHGNSAGHFHSHPAGHPSATSHEHVHDHS